MRHITIHLEDDRFDHMPAEEVPAFIFDLIRHDLWHITDPRAHLSEISVEVPPEPVQPAVVELADVVESEAEVEELQQIMRLETAMVKAKAAA